MYLEFILDLIILDWLDFIIFCISVVNISRRYSKKYKSLRRSPGTHHLTSICHFSPNHQTCTILSSSLDSNSTVSIIDFYSDYNSLLRTIKRDNLITDNSKVTVNVICSLVSEPCAVNESKATINGT